MISLENSNANFRVYQSGWGGVNDTRDRVKVRGKSETTGVGGSFRGRPLERAEFGVRNAE
jgi:hypothetical protein